jgi:hypothetical protein
MSDVVRIPEMREPLIPLSILELDLPAPTNGWAAGLAELGIEVRLDDLGRACVARGDARRLFEERRAEQAEAEQRQRKAAEASDRWHQEHYVTPNGVHWTQIPSGMTAGQYLAMTDPDRQRGKRRTPLEDALANDGMTFYSLHEPAEGAS